MRQIYDFTTTIETQRKDKASTIIVFTDGEPTFTITTPTQKELKDKWNWISIVDEEEFKQQHTANIPLHNPYTIPYTTYHTTSYNKTKTPTWNNKNNKQRKTTNINPTLTKGKTYSITTQCSPHYKHQQDKNNNTPHITIKHNNK